MARIPRGDIYWSNLNPLQGNEQARRGLIVIVNHDVLNERLGTVIAMATTSQPQRAGFPLTFEGQSNIMPRQCWMKISQVRTLSILRLDTQVGRLPLEELEKLILNTGSQRNNC